MIISSKKLFAMPYLACKSSTQSRKGLMNDIINNDLKMQDKSRYGILTFWYCLWLNMYLDRGVWLGCLYEVDLFVA